MVSVCNTWGMAQCLCHCSPPLLLTCLVQQCSCQPLPDDMPCSRKFTWGPNFVLFVLSLSEWKFNTWNIHCGGRIFLCKMVRTKIKHTNQLEIAQNEIWTPWMFPTIYTVSDTFCPCLQTLSVVMKLWPFLSSCWPHFDHHSSSSSMDHYDIAGI